jgi:hypothetical protein
MRSENVTATMAGCVLRNRDGRIFLPFWQWKNFPGLGTRGSGDPVILVLTDVPGLPEFFISLFPAFGIRNLETADDAQNGFGLSIG